MLPALARWWRRAVRPPKPIPDALWQATLARYAFLQRLSGDDKARLRRLVTHFLAHKQFSGAHGLRVTDAMAVAVAAQACLPLLHLGPADTPEDALSWYDDFVGIVMHPADAVAARQVMDHAGVVHHYAEVLAGEAMQDGPVMLSWPAVQGDGTGTASSVVIHEFMHKIDMRNGPADGCPPLPAGFLGQAGARNAHAAWQAAWQPAYEQFREQVIIAERFGGDWPWLDAYGATAPAEFFAVACEAYFVDRPRFAQEFPTLAPMLQAFFQPALTG